LIISNHNSFRMLFDKIASEYFIWKIYNILASGQGTSTVPIVSAHFHSVYDHCAITTGVSDSGRKPALAAFAGVRACAVILIEKRRELQPLALIIYYLVKLFNYSSRPPMSFRGWFERDIEICVAHHCCWQHIRRRFHCLLQVRHCYCSHLIQPVFILLTLIFRGFSFRCFSTPFCSLPYPCGWLGSRVVSVPDSGAEGPGFKSQPRRCRVTVLGKLLTHIVPLFTKQQNW